MLRQPLDLFGIHTFLLSAESYSSFKTWISSPGNLSHPPFEHRRSPPRGDKGW